MAEHRNDDMFQKRFFHLICSCFRLPDSGHFTVGQEYTFEDAIDAVKVLDDLGQVIVFSKEAFEAYFCDVADPVYPVASSAPMLHDPTIYHLYFVLEQGRCDLDAIRACSELLHINYVQAKGILNGQRVLIATGDACDLKEILHKLRHFQVRYEISPPYPY